MSLSEEQERAEAWFSRTVTSGDGFTPDCVQIVANRNLREPVPKTQRGKTQSLLFPAISVKNNPIVRLDVIG